MGCCRLETSKPQKYADSLRKCRILLGCCRLGNLKTDRLLWFYVRSKTSKPQKMKNCCELQSKLLESLDLKNFKTIRLMWPQLQTKNFKTAGLLWPELKMGTSKLQNFWISVAPAANQKLKTSKQLDFCDRSSKTSKHLDNSGASCKSKLQITIQLFDHCGQCSKIQNPRPGSGPSCKSKQQLRNSRVILSPAANQKLTTKPENCSVSVTESENSRLPCQNCWIAMTPNTKKRKQKTKTHAASGCI